MIQVCDPPRQRQVRRLSAEEFFTLVRCGGAGFYRPCSEVLLNQCTQVVYRITS